MFLMAGFFKKLFARKHLLAKRLSLNFNSSFSLRNRNTSLLLVLVVFLVIGGLFTPLFQAKAGFITDLFSAFVSAIVVGFFYLYAKLALILMQISNWLLATAINNPFNVPFTTPGLPPDGNPIIAIGWTLLRDITNMLFILGLAYIGLATSLNFGEFQTGRILKNLVIVALIINFTPVITGVVVDISNILSNFFVQGVNFDTVVEAFDSQLKSVNILSWGAMENLANMAKVLALSTYGLFTSVAFLLYAVVFLIRPPIIWILVILSPLTFFFWIFPFSKGFFNQWWKQFIHWSFIVVPSSFFLYLSQQVLIKGANLIQIGEEDPAGGILVVIAPSFVAVLFLFFGFWAALKMNMIGVNTAISIGKSAALGSVGAVAKVGLSKTRHATGALTKRLATKWERMEREVEEGEGGGIKRGMVSTKKWLGKAGRFTAGRGTEEEEKRWQQSKGLRWTRRVLQGTIGTTIGRAIDTAAAQLAEYRKQQIEKAKGKTKGKTVERQKALLRGAVTPEEKIGILQAIKEDKNINKVGVTSTQIESIIKEGLRTGNEAYVGSLTTIDPEITSKIASEMHLPSSVLKKAGMDFTDEDRKAGLENLYQKLLKEMKPSDVGEMKKDAAKKAAEEFGQKVWRGDHISQGAQAFGEEFLEAVERGKEKVRESGRKTLGNKIDHPAVFEKYFMEYNPRLAKYYTSTPARALGIAGFEKREKKEVPEEEIERMREKYSQPVERFSRKKPETKAEKPRGRRGPSPASRGRRGPSAKRQTQEKQEENVIDVEWEEVKPESPPEPGKAESKPKNTDKN